VVGMSAWRLGFDARPVCVGFVEDKVAVGQAFDVITSLVSLVYWGFRCEKVTSHGKSYSKCSVTSLRDISIVGVT
jgi:hypothetical protein